MRLSQLQKYILMKCYEKYGKIGEKTEFYDYYSSKAFRENKIAVQAALQKSFENLVKKDLIITYGHKTVKKWHVDKIKLTLNGKRIAKILIKDRQRKLPIR